MKLLIMKLLILTYLVFSYYVFSAYYNAKIIETKYDVVCMVIDDDYLKPVVNNGDSNIIVTHYNLIKDEPNKIITYRKDVSITTELCLYALVLFTIGAIGFCLMYIRN